MVIKAEEFSIHSVQHPFSPLPPPPPPFSTTSLLYKWYYPPPPPPPPPTNQRKILKLQDIFYENAGQNEKISEKLEQCSTMQDI